MMTESELFSSAFIAYVFLYERNYGRLPRLEIYNRVECFELSNLVYNIKIESQISREKIELRDMNHNIMIHNLGVISQDEFKIQHYERYSELRFQITNNRIKIDENNNVYYAQLEASDRLVIDTEQYPRVTYHFRFS